MKVFISFIVVLGLALCQDETPPFLKGASPQIQQEFKSILARGEDKTEDDLEADIEAWVSRQSSDIKSSFDSFVQQMKSKEKQADAQHQAGLGKLSSAAKEADMKLTQMMSDHHLTGREKQEKVEEFFKALPSSVQQELKSAAGN